MRNLPKPLAAVLCALASALVGVACDSLTKPYPGLPNEVTAASAAHAAASSGFGGGGGSPSGSSSSSSGATSSAGGATASASSGSSGSSTSSASSTSSTSSSSSGGVCLAMSMGCQSCTATKCVNEATQCGGNPACSQDFVGFLKCVCNAQDAKNPGLLSGCLNTFNVGPVEIGLNDCIQMSCGANICL